MGNDPADVPVENLTWREQEVLALLAERLTNREIGDRLHLTENTVKAYVGSILSKLYVKNRRQAVERARTLGLLDADRKAPSRPRHNLPADPTPFIGRAEQLAEIDRLLAQTRLLTLTGPGGVGKTRLALRAAADSLDAFDHGVFFVSLAPIRSARHIVQAIAEAVDFPLSTEEDPLDQLLGYLRRRQLLLVMDNFEHLLDGADIVGEILQKAPNVRVLATSREMLNLQGETALSVSGLDFPIWEPSDDLLTYDAVQLFLQSAHRVDPGFEPGASDLRHLAHICEMVQGMPLAIELAAAWMAVLCPEEIADEVRKGLDILTTEMRDVPERHRSIRVVFDHSWSLMDQTEREVFMRLSVFCGGFTREAAQQVAGASLQSLAGLVSKSFLRHDPTSGRFEIHELLRQYAQERLEESPEASISAHDAHAAYYADFMEQCWQHLRDHRQITALAEIDADIENVRTAWRYRVDQRDAVQMRMFINSFWFVYWVRGWNHAAAELFGEAVEALREEPGEEAEALRALALAHQGYFLSWLGLSQQGYELAKESIAILEELDCPEELALALASLNLNAYSLNLPAVFEEAAHRFNRAAAKIDDKWLLAYSLSILSLVALRRQDYAEVRRLSESGLKMVEEIDNPSGMALPLLMLGHVGLALGEYAEAKACYLRCMSASEKVGYRWAIQNATKYLGRVAFSMGEMAEAKAYYLQSLRIADEVGLGRDMVTLLYDVARVWAAEGRCEQAAELLALVLQHPASHQARMALETGRIRDSAQDLLATLEFELSPEVYAAALERGQTLALDEVVAAILRDEG
jgi:predicted ATPase/DNA-binding CsgD family transcriptional regulator